MRNYTASFLGPAFHRRVCLAGCARARHQHRSRSSAAPKLSMSRLIRTLGILAIGVAAFAAAPAVADGPLTIVSPASGETLKMFSPMTLKIDPGFSIALDVDFGNFEVRVGGFKLGNVTLSQLRGGVTYALDPSVPLGMNGKIWP